jgi:hypothetical protein
MLGCLLAASTALAAPQSAQSSSGAEKLSAAIAGAPVEQPLLVEVDRGLYSPLELQQVLYALLDRRESGGVSIAIATEAKGGAAAIALACDTLILLGSDPLLGADSAWCASPSQQRAIAGDLARLGRIEPTLAARLLSTDGALSWTPGLGLAADMSGQLLLASPGAQLRLDKATFDAIGIEVHQVASPLDAITIATSGSLKTRPDLAPPAKPATPSAPAGGATSGSTAASAPGKSPSAAPKPDAAISEIARKIAPRLAEYAKELEELKADLRTFDDYYAGRKGRWTSEHDNLREVWAAGSDHTKDQDTKLACERLQRDMKATLRKLENAANSIERIVGDVSHPEVARLKANQVVLDGFRAALERNKVSNYDDFQPKVLKLK